MYAVDPEAKLNLLALLRLHFSLVRLQNKILENQGRL